VRSSTAITHTGCDGLEHQWWCPTLFTNHAAGRIKLAECECPRVGLCPAGAMTVQVDAKCPECGFIHRPWIVPADHNKPGLYWIALCSTCLYQDTSEPEWASERIGLTP